MRLCVAIAVLILGGSGAAGAAPEPAPQFPAVSLGVEDLARVSGGRAAAAPVVVSFDVKLWDERQRPLPGLPPRDGTVTVNGHGVR